MDYFKLNEIQNYTASIGKKYESDSAAANWYFDTRTKLEHLVKLLGEATGYPLIPSYDEKPNKQAGRGKGFELRAYVLLGFTIADSKAGEHVFIKLVFHNFENAKCFFAIEVDIDFKNNKDLFTQYLGGGKHIKKDRDQIHRDTYWETPVDETFPSDWETLVDLILPKVKEDVEYLRTIRIQSPDQVLRETENPKQNIMPSINTYSPPLNQILYGPPGTGKTFHTINHALAIIEDKSIEEIGKEKREDLLARFKNYRDQKQIEFTTFHQSMSYEDFVEGIKPLKPEENDKFVKYEVRPGIFKTSAARAAYSCYSIHRVKAAGKAYDFDMLYDAFIEDISKKLEQNIVPEFYTKTNSKIKVIRINKNDSILATAIDSIRKDGPAPKTRNNFRKLYQKFQSIDEIKTLQDIRDEIKILPGISGFYALFKGLKEFEKSFKPAPDEEEAQDLPNLTDEKIVVQFSEGNFTDAVIAEARLKDKKAEKHVLIIDEINRGNVSQIFGELITLLETDKRMGNDEALEVTLPYSKDSFSVPPNLYLIGTMNTADRSVEALDTALRRRFSFVEMPPNEQLLTPSAMFWRLLNQYATVPWDNDDYKVKEKQLFDFIGAGDFVKANKKSYWNKTEEEPFDKKYFSGFHLDELLSTLNRRIEKLLDKDHLIGHSYFLNVLSLDDLKNTFYRNIIPLLQEYFFGDFGKIGLVLGAGFVEMKESKGDFADFSGYTDTAELEERWIYRIKKEADLKEGEFESALNLLLKKQQ
jgi:5-methylcytosine-specific restriction protein B